ncbi:hypothetical protein C8R44DRAFT_872290 [Mycena epipterygia]|nr:hypothetical protein C8R44DRAFT_872290 [Mycena epipterygia]
MATRLLSSESPSSKYTPASHFLQVHASVRLLLKPVPCVGLLPIFMRPTFITCKSVPEIPTHQDLHVSKPPRPVSFQPAPAFTSGQVSPFNELDIMKRTSSQPVSTPRSHGLATRLVLRRLAHHPRNIKPSSQDLAPGIYLPFRGSTSLSMFRIHLISNHHSSLGDDTYSSRVLFNTSVSRRAFPRTVTNTH